jgi:hypothetical protein
MKIIMRDKEINQKSTFNPDYKHEALEIAIADFEKFCKYSGVNHTQLKVCIERSKGLTLGQISQKLKVPKTTIKNICDRCFE